jgi:hypothetical protein
MSTRRFAAAVLGLSLSFAYAGCDSQKANGPKPAGVADAGADAPCPHCLAEAAATKPTTKASADSCEDCDACTTKPTTQATTQPTGGALTASPTTKPAAAAAAETSWRDLFDGKSIEKNWKIADFAGHGEVEVKDGLIVLPSGEGLTGVTYTGKDLPKIDYEVEVVAQRVDGVDFFCGITFPVKETHASLICGGWGGTVVGISSIDDMDAAHNDYSTNKSFKLNKWYTIKLRVTADKLTAWIDGEQMVDADIKDKKVSVRADIDEAKPFGVAAWQTTSQVKSIRIRPIK